ncbi:trypsin-1-like [Penaeus chinensis]|uniref:trypsin-1-like n=1 Tax=Penaeus chinensis TaxID=139456 RepID=UPI001FB632D3|nr:trypsin-1-like [Penaeus chinensis]
MTKQPDRPYPSLFVISVSLIIIAFFPLSIAGKEEELAHDDGTADDTPSPNKTEDEDPFLAGLKAYEQRWLDRINRNSNKNNRTANSSYSDLEQPDEEWNEVSEKGEGEKNWREGRRRSFLDWFKDDQWKPLFVDKDCECGKSEPLRGRIINGEETEKHQYPWMVALLYKKKSFCGASIISDRVVLTAAHCTDGMTPEALKVKIGDHDLTQKDVSREWVASVRKIIQHDGYDSITMNNDISLVFLTSKLTFTWRVAPLCLTPYDVTYYKEQVLVMGWGLTSEGDKESSSPVLLQAKVKVIGMSHCRTLYGFESIDVTGKMICALGENTDGCNGDSGGPLVWKDDVTGRYFQVGLTSWGLGCGNPEYPGVYVKLNKYLDWVYANTGDSVFCSTYNPKLKGKNIQGKKQRKGGQMKKNGRGNSIIR